MVFIVLRHGESKWNKENKFTGFTDIDLNEVGIQEAKDVGHFLSNIPLYRIFTSDLKRTVHTGELIGNKQHDKNNLHFIQAEELKERDYGDLTGKNKTELAQEYGEPLVKTWRRSYFDGPPNGENLEDVAKRCGKYYDENIAPLLHQHKNILMVSHGNTIRALFCHLGIKDSETVERLEIPTGVPIQISPKTKEFKFENNYELSAYQIIDSRGFPTIEAQCVYRENNRIIGKGSSPSGASCGSTEVLELRDGNPKEFHGKSVFKAVKNVHQLNKVMVLKNSMITDLKKCDKQFIDYDNTAMKTNLGGNTTTALSFCMADVGANLLKIPLYEYFDKIYKTRHEPIDVHYLPTPLVNIINGGKHSVTGELKIQEFMIYPKHGYSVSEKTKLVVEIYHSLKKILVSKYGEGAKSIGDEGGFCPPIYTAEEALCVIEEAIEASDYVPNKDVFIALDCAASEFYDEETKTYEVEKDLKLSSFQLVGYYGKLMDDHPALKSIEDGFHEKDYEAWKKFTHEYGDRLMVVGDDLFTTNPGLIKQGLREKWANTLLLKVNQIGTISEAVEGANMLLEEGKEVIVSHRSGETNHAYIVDLAVGIGAKFLKIGSPCRGERVAKFNRLLEIEHNLK